MKQKVIKQILDLFDDNSIIFLRGGDKQARQEGDLDFLVPLGKSNYVCNIIVKYFRGCGWKLLSFRDIGYLSTFTIVLKSENETVAIKIDIFNGLSWRALGDMQVDDKFFHQILPEINNTESRLRLVSAINFLHKTMYAGKLSKRDIARINCEWHDVNNLVTRLDWKVDESIFPSGAGFFNKWSLRFQSSNAHSIFDFIRWLFYLFIKSFESRIGYKWGSGLSICISGMDGSGKSTQFDEILTWYKKSGMELPYFIHFVPSFIPLPHQVFKRKKTVNNYTAPYTEVPVKNKLSIVIRKCWYLITFALSKLYVLSLTKTGGLVLSDRSFIDFTADLERVKIPHVEFKPFFKRMLTLKGLNLYLDTNPISAVSRKGELTIERANLLKKRYLLTINQVSGTIIDGELSQTEVSINILNKIDQHFYKELNKKYKN